MTRPAWAGDRGSPLRSAWLSTLARLPGRIHHAPPRLGTSEPAPVELTAGPHSALLVLGTRHPPWSFARLFTTASKPLSPVKTSPLPRTLRSAGK